MSKGKPRQGNQSWRWLRVVLRARDCPQLQCRAVAAGSPLPAAVVGPALVVRRAAGKGLPAGLHELHGANPPQPATKSAVSVAKKVPFRVVRMVRGSKRDGRFLLTG